MSHGLTDKFSKSLTPAAWLQIEKKNPTFSHCTVLNLITPIIKKQNTCVAYKYIFHLCSLVIHAPGYYLQVLVQILAQEAVSMQLNQLFILPFELVDKWVHGEIWVR